MYVYVCVAGDGGSQSRATAFLPPSDCLKKIPEFLWNFLGKKNKTFDSRKRPERLIEKEERRNGRSRAPVAGLLRVFQTVHCKHPPPPPNPALKKKLEETETKWPPGLFT